MPLVNRTFTPQELEDLNVRQGYVAKEFVEKLRWYLLYNLTFKYEGKFYSVPYSEPATEMQDQGDPWDGQVDVLAFEVELIEKTVTVKTWQPVQVAQSGRAPA